MAVTDRLNHPLNPIVRGDNYAVELEFKAETGDPIDLSGRALYFTLKRHWQQPDDEAAAQSKVALAGSPAQNGIGIVSLLPDDTDTLVPGSYWYDLQLVTGDNEVLTISRGRVEVVGDVTRRAEL